MQCMIMHYMIMHCTYNIFTCTTNHLLFKKTPVKIIPQEDSQFSIVIIARACSHETFLSNKSRIDLMWKRDVEMMFVIIESNNGRLVSV